MKDNKKGIIINEINKNKGFIRKYLRILTISILGCLLITCCSSYYPILMDSPINNSNKDSFWETIDVENTGLSRKAIIKHLKLCKDTGADSQIIIYKDKIVSEWYSERYMEPIGAMSSTKVVASLLIGILADMGKINYVDKVSDILPEWSGGYRDNVKIVDLLTHSAGFERRIDDTSIGFVNGDKTDFALNISPDYAPATKFSYSNEGVQLLEPIIQVTSGIDTEEFAKQKLFNAIGMNNTAFHNYGGSPWLYSELHTTARDLARLGVLMCNDGKWGEQQIISKDYIDKATAPSIFENQMGYLWWILDGEKTVNGFYASGYLNTDIYVFKDYDVVIVRTQSPKNGFSGKAESKDYFNRAMPIYKEIVGEK